MQVEATGEIQVPGYWMHAARLSQTWVGWVARRKVIGEVEVSQGD